MSFLLVIHVEEIGLEGSRPICQRIVMVFIIYKSLNNPRQF